MIKSVTNEAEKEIEDKTVWLCMKPEPDIPAPTMQRCIFLKNHEGKHSWEKKDE
jgi:hypothetical protein